ncbi:hypothetical protein GS399_01320 [Pedobacter sp. HMF7647]|uniref:Tetratricopeptide repeat protein n=1 Tax=Hufsiella arboris TaxID=2695275 RepID=A0A7K1Y4T8_9SPHI|nr:hypothetical protein [Hufsiella arboris]MXV49597.1 hypothetical protein [Hufsiella arboris]
MAQISASDSVFLQNNQKANRYYLTSRQYFSQKRPDDAFAELLKAESLYRKIGNQIGLASVNESYADFYAANKMSDDALRYYEKGLLLLTSTESDSLAGELAFKIARLNYRKNDTDEAIKYFAYSISRFEKAAIKNGQAKNYVQIASIRRQQKKYIDAESIILKDALPKFRNGEDNTGRIGCFNVLAGTYQDQKRYSEAKWFYLQGNELARTIGDTSMIITSLTKLAQVKISINDYDLALRDLKEAQQLAEKTKSVRLLSDVKLAMSQLYAKMGQKKKQDLKGKLLIAG